MSGPSFILHSTPPLQGLPASDRESIYLAGLLQLACPGQWGVVAADWSDNGGKIPYLTHRGRHVRPRHLTSLPSFNDPDESLEGVDKADCEIWKAYIEGHLIDLVYHTLYSLPLNHAVLAKAQTADCGYFEKNYVSQRLKGVHKARLQHIGIWGLGGLEESDSNEDDRKRLEEAFIIGPAGTQAPRAWAGWRSGREYEKRKRLWGEEEISNRIKAALDPLVRRLGEGTYFFGSRPTSLDISLFASLALILTPNLPNALFANHLRAYYPSLVAHHNRILSSLFGSWDTVPRIPKPPRPTLFESAANWWHGDYSSEEVDGERKKVKKKSDKDKAFERGRWLWFAAAGVAMVGYVLASGLIKIEIGGDEVEEEDIVEIIGEDVEEEDDEEDEDEEEEEEGEEDAGGDTESPLAAFTARDEDEDESEEGEGDSAK